VLNQQLILDVGFPTDDPQIISAVLQERKLMSVLRVSKKGKEESIYTEQKCKVCEFKHVMLNGFI
jgi:hypothetical protein